MSENSPLTPKQEHCIELLVAGTNITAAAKACGINPQTVHRWRKDPVFAARYQEARARVFDDHLSAMESTVLVTLLKHIKADVKPSGFTQITALRLWHDMRMEGQRTKELEAAFEEWRMNQSKKDEWEAI